MLIDYYYNISFMKIKNGKRYIIPYYITIIICTKRQDGGGVRRDRGGGGFQESRSGRKDGGVKVRPQEQPG